MSDREGNFNDSFFGAMIAIILILVIFDGDPDIATSMRIWAGKQAGTLPHDYVYIPEINRTGENDEAL